MNIPDTAALGKALAKNKYLLLAVCLGLLLLLLPKKRSSAENGNGAPMAASGIPVDTESGRIAALLSSISGVGDAEVLLSGSGAVVVCRGADDPRVCLDVTNAVAAYTGLGCDRITVMKMK